MIPSTYRMIRAQYPNAGLMPDFVEGMRNHVNATAGDAAVHADDVE